VKGIPTSSQISSAERIVSVLNGTPPLTVAGAAKGFVQLRHSVWLAINSIRQRQSSFAYGSAITIVLNSAAIVLYGVGSILVSRKIGPEQTGLLVWFVTGTATIALFADCLGIYYSNAHLIASGHEGFELASIRTTVLLYGLVIGLLVGLLFGLVPAARSRAFPGSYVGVWIPLIVLNILGLVLIAQIRGLFWGKGSFLLVGSLWLLKTGAYSLVSVSFAYLLNWKQASQMAIAQVIATWSCVLAALPYFAYRGLAGADWKYLRACMSVGWRAAGVNLFTFLHQRLDQYFVKSFSGAEALGLYGTIVSIGEMLTQVPGMLGMVMFSLVAREKDGQRAARTTLRRTLVVIVIASVLMAPVSYIGPTLIRFLYGERFAGAGPLLVRFLPAVVFLSGLLLVNNHLSGRGYPLSQLFAAAGALAANVLLNLTLLPRWGVLGAPVSASISYGIWLLLVGACLLNTMRDSERRTTAAQD
jgi:O-antigen/teichoic acid export membrane protein